jgi:PAS domain S-box-containing protein
VVSQVEHVVRPGYSRWVMSTKVPVRDERGQVRMIVGVARDITEWNEMLEALQHSEASFRRLFTTVPHALWVCDLETYRFLEVNHAAERQYGYTAAEFRAMTIFDVYPPADHERLRRTLAALDPANLPRGERKHLTKDGRTLTVEIAVHPLEVRGRRAILILSQDLTERRRMEVELRQAQRLEAVGQLAAGIAHEINTPIQYIGDNLRFLQEAFAERQVVVGHYERLRRTAREGTVETGQLDTLDQAIENADMQYFAAQIPKALEQSLEGVERVATIVRAMKSFAHPGQQQKAAADLNKSLADALLVARNEIKYVADVETAFGDIPPVICHVADVNQVLLNLLVNAAHAIADVFQKTQRRGLIRVETERAGNQVVVRVADTGCGIPENIQSRIFDPFFTTKEVGKGTGQGLAIARSVVERHSGRITFHANQPQGTVFVVTLPIESPPASASAEGSPERATERA